MRRAASLFLLLGLAGLAPARVAAEASGLAVADAMLPNAALESALPAALAAPIDLITDKPKLSPTGDAHDYVSYARYYWPDPAKPDGLPFIRRDGHHNREQVAAGDRAKIDHLTDHVRLLALGWSRLHREDCARRAGDWVRAWFVAPATRMKPGLDYAQVRLGHNHNLGSAPGVLDTRDFAEVVAALGLLRGSPALTAEEDRAVQAWFAEFFTWLQTAPSGRGEHAAKNNHGTWYLVQAVAIARYLGRDADARALCEEDKARIATQFAPDGSQPEELAREDSLHYSHFNLLAHLRLAVAARALGVELWSYTAPNGASLRQAVAYLRPYDAAPATWPHRELEAKPAGFMAEMLLLADRLAAKP